MLRVNIGCGRTPTRGWRNFDNSPSIRLANIPVLPQVLQRLRLLGEAQYQFVEFARANAIEYGDAARGLPIPAGSVDVVYSSHMLEHLDRQEADTFLIEVRRLLRPGGIIRLAVPDIRQHVERYNASSNADEFIEATQLSVPRPRSLAQRLQLLLAGTRHHQWMYDSRSLCGLLRKHGFVNAVALAAGVTTIRDHHPLNLCERSSESIYVEAENPLGS